MNEIAFEVYKDTIILCFECGCVGLVIGFILKKEKEMTEERLIEILKADYSYDRDDRRDRVFEGLKIVKKYLPDKDAVEAAEHDEIFSAPLSSLAEAGITEEDAKLLRSLGWRVDDFGEGLAHFVYNLTEEEILKILKSDGGHIDYLYLSGAVRLWPGNISIKFSQFDALRKKGIIDLDSKHWQGCMAYCNNTKYDTYKLVENQNEKA